MKELHLIANAHIDPIWQWQWNEGIAATIATFRSAADLADEFDYVFCHNEAVIYKYVEKYTPELFGRIKKLIRSGKWKIMGGWYLQPDCNMPSGESFVRQILTGRKYFMNSLGTWSTTAVNVDSFGHSVGLPQIIKKCGQDAYLCCRCGLDEYTPGSQFLWESPDGSRIKVNGAFFGYGTGAAAGSVVPKIRHHNEFFKEENVVCVLWGVGNHGGGPSRTNLREIDELIRSGELNVLHSDPDTFFAKLDPDKVHRLSMRTVMPGCYTSMHRLKKAHVELENALYFTEKICSVSSMRGLMEYPETALNEACEDLLKIEFHDSLPGTLVKSAEEEGLRIAGHAMTILEEARDHAFFRLASQEKKAADGEYPILVFNPYPYEYETDVECEFSLADTNWDDVLRSHMRVYDRTGNELRFQVVKEESNLVALDWRKKILIHCILRPMQLNRLSLFVDFLPDEGEKKAEYGDVTVHTEGKHVEIDASTGLMRSFRINGEEQLSGEAFRLISYDDVEDPWAMREEWLKGMGRNPVPFELMREPHGIFAGNRPVQVIEDGDIMTAVEAFFECGGNMARIEYDIYKTNPYVDIKIDTFCADFNRMIKLEIPCAKNGRYIGQIAYGTEKLDEDGRETVAQRFNAIEDGGEAFAVFNNGTYGASVKDHVIHISLLRTTTYCAHPTKEGHPFVRHDRYNRRMDMGEASFGYRIGVLRTCELERVAEEFNVRPFALNVFPVEESRVPGINISSSDRDIVLKVLKKADGSGSYVFRFFNNSGTEKKAVLTAGGTSSEFTFGRYEVKTVIYDGELKEAGNMII